ncbi:MAG: hypothetical protein AABY07_01565 [Nanoarchaeota archaeon]
MSVNTFAKIKKTKKGKYSFMICNADTGKLETREFFPTLKEAMKAFKKANAEGWIEYGLQDIDLPFGKPNN